MSSDSFCVFLLLSLTDEGCYGLGGNNNSNSINDNDGGQLCRVMFHRDRQDYPLNFPTVVQFVPGYSSSWQSFWEIISRGGDTVACMKVEGKSRNTLIHTSPFNCGNVSSWSQTVIWPPFLLGRSKWGDVYSLFVTAGDETFTVTLNQNPNNAIDQRLSNGTPASIIRLNMTKAGPKTKFSKINVFENCIALDGCRQENSWVYLSHVSSDNISLVPKDVGSLEFKVTLSICFPEYVLGVFYTAMEEEVFVFRVSYRRQLHYHTLSASVNERVILLKTTKHNGLNCSGDWFLTGVRGAVVIPNCRYHHTSLPSSTNLPLLSTTTPPSNDCVVFNDYTQEMTSDVTTTTTTAAATTVTTLSTLFNDEASTTTTTTTTTTIGTINQQQQNKPFNELVSCAGYSFVMLSSPRFLSRLLLASLAVCLSMQTDDNVTVSYY